MPTKPRTQRKAVYELALHERRPLVSAHLSKELKAKLGTKARSMPLRKGDRVKIMRGSHKGKTGKITEVDLRSTMAFVEGIFARKAKGGEKPLPLQPSNLLILEGDFSDKERKAALDRKKGRG
jgi:large subunit ribosomal protein L24